MPVELISIFFCSTQIAQSCDVSRHENIITNKAQKDVGPKILNVDYLLQDLEGVENVELHSNL